MIITPRAVDKSKLSENDFIEVRPDLRRRTIEYSGGRKPSIDSGVHAATYASDPGITAILHSHNPWPVSAPKTEFPFPCGVTEEAEEILAKLRPDPVSVVELAEHGTFVVLRGEDAVKTLSRDWSRVKEDWREHLSEIGAAMPEGAKIVPMFSENRIVGSVLVHEDATASPRLLEEFRGCGMGIELIKKARAR